MKKLILSIVALLALTLAGCEDNRTQEQKQQAIDDRLTRYNLSTVNYRGHSYIVYEGYREGCITHDPDCPCRENGGVRCGKCWHELGKKPHSHGYQHMEDNTRYAPE